MDTLNDNYNINSKNNYTNNNPPWKCPEDIPSTEEYYKNLPYWGNGILIMHGIICLVCLVIFVDVIVFLFRNFTESDRLNGTIWVVGVFPVYCMTSLISVAVPKSGMVVNLTCDLYFAAALYRLIGLMENYLGGQNSLHKLLSHPRDIHINTLPFCLCCFCLPLVKLDRRNYHIIHMMIVQVAIVRPAMVFTAAVIWSNGNLAVGFKDLANAYIYIFAIILISTIFSVWGLCIINDAFKPELDRYKMTGKLISVKLLLIAVAVTSITIISIASAGVFQCTSYLPAGGEADSLYHQIMNFFGCVFMIVARFFYRRLDDAEGSYHYVEHEHDSFVSVV